MNKVTLESRVLKCEKEKLDTNILGEDFKKMIIDYCFFKNIPFESIFLGLLTTASTLCGKSIISATRGYKQPFSFYSVFVGGVSSRKSNCIDLIKNEFTEMLQVASNMSIFEISESENQANISKKKNKEKKKIHLNAILNNSITVESLFEELENQQTLMQFWDEFQTLLSSYSKYNSDENFARSVILSVYNGSKDYAVQFKKGTLYFNNPRISIFTAGHYHNVEDLIEQEKKKADGFISRFLLCSPEPMRIKLKDQRDFTNPITLMKIFLAIQVKHIMPLDYTFNADAFDLLNDEIAKLDNISEKFQIKNIFLSAIFGKASGQLIRLSGILQCLSQIMKIFVEIQNINDLNIEELAIIIRDKPFSSEITREIVEKAIKVNEFFMKQKLYLGGILDFNFESRELIISNENITKKLSSNEIIEFKILTMFKGPTVFLTDFSRKKIGKEIDFVQACQKLQEKKLGIFDDSAFRDGSTKKSKCFRKSDFSKIPEDQKISFINSLINYNISIDDYQRFYTLEQVSQNVLAETIDDKEETENQSNLELEQTESQGVAIENFKRKSYSTQFNEEPKKN